MANLTSTQIENWQKKIDKAIKTDLVKLMQNTGTAAAALAKTTKSDGDATLSQRYTDLNKLTTQAAKQLTTFMNSFDTSLKSYISAVKKAATVAQQETNAAIDQFAERASEISKLKM